MENWVRPEWSCMVKGSKQCTGGRTDMRNTTAATDSRRIRTESESLEEKKPEDH